jgi:hypothetical protein
MHVERLVFTGDLVQVPIEGRRTLKGKRKATAGTGNRVLVSPILHYALNSA